MDGDYTDEYKYKQQENLRNPKNRFLGFLCHAKDVDTAWGCDWSFQCGVITFSIVILVASFWDIYELAHYKVFQIAPNGWYSFFFGLKVFSDVVNFIDIILSCFAVHKHNLKYSIISYWVGVLSLLLNTLFCLYMLIAMFIHFDKIWHEIPAAIILEVGLFLFTWILFCNQVVLGRERQKALNPTQ